MNHDFVQVGVREEAMGPALRRMFGRPGPIAPLHAVYECKHCGLRTEHPFIHPEAFSQGLERVFGGMR